MEDTVDTPKDLGPICAARNTSHSDRFFKVLTQWHLTSATKLLDFSAIVVVAILAYFIAVRAAGNDSFRYALSATAVAMICNFFFSQGHLYNIDALLNETKTIKAMAWRWTLVFMGLATMAVLTHQQDLFSRFWFVGFYGSGIAALAAERSIVALLIRSWVKRGYSTKSVIIVGENELAEQLIGHLEANRFGIRIAAVFDDRNQDNAGHLRGVQKLGGLDDLIEYAKLHVIDIVVITLPIAATDRISAVIKYLQQLPLNICILPGTISLQRFSPIRFEREDLPGVQLITVADPPISEFELFFKEVFDRMAALFGIVLILPVLAICTIGIALTSPGPIFFRQKRVGYKGHEFEILKFRTMNVAKNPHTKLTQRNDPRVFKFGSILRKFSLDELPQLINVVKGDMSLVGPRPHMPDARAAGKLYFEAVTEYAARHRVKPGITGWAQVNGWRGPTETLEQIERRVEHDIYYIENWSLMLDFVILAKTLYAGFFGKNTF